MSDPARLVRIAACLATVLVAAGAAGAPVRRAAPQPERPVYKVDSVIATLTKGKILVQVKGAVQSGGWKNPRLRLTRSPNDPHTLVVDFLATPPAPDAPVIQALLPVSAQTVLPRRKGVVAVRAVSDANEMTAQILDSTKR
jgi:hypothetical protein